MPWFDPTPPSLGLSGDRGSGRSPPPVPNRAFVLAAHSVRVVTAFLSCERHSPGRRRRHHCPSSLLEPPQDDLHRKSEMNGAFQPIETRKTLQWRMTRSAVRYGVEDAG